MSALLVAGGLLLLAAGSEALVRGAKGLALSLGMSPLSIGLTVVAVATSSPELAVSLQAGLAGNAGVALGNVVGSNISNVLLVLALSAVVRPMTVRAEVIRREIPVMIACTLALCACLADGVVERAEGLALVLGGIAYLLLAYRWGRQAGTAGVDAEFRREVAEPPRAAWLNGCLVAGGLLVLLFGATALIRGAVALATRWGVSEMTIGLTIVAVGTSLPELASSVVAAAKGEGDIVFGNVLGSNAFNILLVLGLTAVASPVSAQGLRAADLTALVASALLLYPLARRRHRVNRVEGTILLLSYGLYLHSLRG